jgi:hypothetical protein
MFCVMRNEPKNRWFLTYKAVSKSLFSRDTFVNDERPMR